MTFTAKQQAAIDRAPAAQKGRLRALYQRQRSSLPTPPRSRTVPRTRLGGPPKSRRRAAGPKRRARQGGLSNNNLLSSLSTAIVPVLRNQATAFPVHGMVRKTFSTGTAARHLFVLCNSGRSGSIIQEFFASNPPGVPNPYTYSLLAAADTAGGPTSGRAMKLGLTVSNATAALSAGGRVYVLNCDQRVFIDASPSNLSQAELNAFIDRIIAFPTCRAFSGRDFTSPRHFHSHVVDAVDYEEFGEWNGTYTPDQLGQHWAIWPTADPYSRPMSTLFIVFEVPAADQDYTLVGRASWYTRWPLNTVGAIAQRPVPTAAPAVLDRIHKTAAATSDPLHSVS